MADIAYYILSHLLQGKRIAGLKFLSGLGAVAGVSILVLRPSETFTKRFLVRSRL